jgi:hypothetical protein
MWTNGSSLKAVETLVQQERLRSFAPVEKTARSCEARRDGPNFDYDIQNINPELVDIAADIPATAGIIFRNFLSGKRNKSA